MDLNTPYFIEFSSNWCLHIFIIAKTNFKLLLYLSFVHRKNLWRLDCLHIFHSTFFEFSDYFLFFKAISFRLHPCFLRYQRNFMLSALHQDPKLLTNYPFVLMLFFLIKDLFTVMSFIYYFSFFVKSILYKVWLTKVFIFSFEINF